MANQKKTTNSLENLHHLMGIKPSPPPDFVGFLDREDEFRRLDEFMASTDRRVLVVSGVPMIGKTNLVEAFTKSRKVSCQKVYFSGKPADPFDQFSSQLSSGLLGSAALLRIENFENALTWEPFFGSHQLHVVSDPRLVHALSDLLANSSLKIIIESRFQMQLPRAIQSMADPRPIILSAVPREYFWDLYVHKSVSRHEFDSICRVFNEHTGLLALIYDNSNFLYEDKLDRALRSPKIAFDALWEVVALLINKLTKEEKTILSAIVHGQKPVDLAELGRVVPKSLLPELERTVFSLQKKLLVTLGNDDKYSVNPYLSEVCFTYLEKSPELRMLQSEGFLKETVRPKYHPIKQSIDRGEYQKDYKKFYDEIKKLREVKKFDEAIEILEHAFHHDPVINKTNVLTELAIFFREKGQPDKTMGILDGILKEKEDDLRALNEKGITLRLTGKYAEARKIFEKAAEQDHYPAIHELALMAMREKRADEARALVERGLGIKPTDKRLLELQEKLSR